LDHEEALAILEASVDTVIVTNELGTIVFANESLAGHTPNMLLGTTIIEHLSREDASSLRGAMARASQNAEPTRCDLTLELPDGRCQYLETRIVPLRRPAEPPRLVHFMRDATKQHEAESALERTQMLLLQAQKMEAVGRFAGSIAHDFNNVLTAIRYHTAFALEDLAEPSPAIQELRDIDAAARRGAELTGQLLAFGRRQVMVPRVLDLNEVVEETSSMLRRLVGERIELVNELHPAPVKVKADQGQLAQVLTNLVINAKDAISGDGTIRIRTSEDQTGRVVLSVEDDGEGMSDETRAQIFEPFFTTKEVGEGTGLGLATVYGVVRQSGGEITVDSELGSGTRFDVLLPRVDGPVWRKPAHTERPEHAPRSPRVLLVEDDEQLRRSASRVLSKRGYVVLEAVGGEEALDIYDHHDGGIDLVLSDVVMPHMTGPELIERIASEATQPAVLLMSGYTESGILEKIRWPLLPKPFSPQDLVEKVREVLADQRGQPIP
jgi:PAS domain S-box-containing protein